MTPILYARGTTDFENNGIGHLKDAVSCVVTEERNGLFELVLKYPITGSWYSSIVEGCIIKAKPNETNDLQLFRIYKSSKPINGIVTFSAEHISYDLKGIPISSFEVGGVTPGEAMTEAFSVALLPHSFTAWSDIDTLNATKITEPCSLRRVLGGQAGSILDVWGGEFEFDNFVVKLHAHRGTDNGVILRYGKNLTDANQEKNIAECYTHFYPYAIKTNEEGEEEEIIELPEKLLELVDPENVGHQKALTLDMTEYFGEDEEITVAKLRQIANKYVEIANLGVPKINITVSFEQIWQSPEYEQFADFERVSLCDTVTVQFEELGIDAKAKVIKTEYDILAERYNKVVIGDAKSSLTDRMVSITKEISAEELRARMSEIVLSSKIIQTAESISTEVTRATGAESALSSRITQTAESISTEVTRATGAESALSSRITQQANKIELVVEEKNGSNVIKAASIVTAINDAGSTVKISADHINLSGYVTISSLGAGGTTVIDGARIGTGYISANRIAANSIAVSKLTGSISNGNWKIDLDAGTFTIGNISASNITTGTLSADRIAANSIAVSKLTGSISNSGWELNLTNGTFTIGNIAASKITSGTIDTARLNVSGIITAGQANIETIVTNKVTASYVNALNIEADSITVQDSSNNTIFNASKTNRSVTIGGFTASQRSLTNGTLGSTQFVGIYSSFSGSTTIAGTSSSNWRIIAGNNFGVTREGYVYASQMTLSGSSIMLLGGGTTANPYIYLGNVNDSHTVSSRVIRVYTNSEDMFYVNQYGETYINGQTTVAGVTLKPAQDNYSTLGNSAYHWKQLFANTATINVSDESTKTEIESIREVYGDIFDELEPIQYLRIGGDRIHFGFGARAVEQTILKHGLTSLDMAALCYDDIDEDGETKRVYGLRYEEFIPLCVDQIQKLKGTVARLECEINILKGA